MPRDFRLQVFLGISFPQAPEYIRAVSNLFSRKFAEIFAVQGAPQIKKSSIRKVLFFLGTPLCSRINIQYRISPQIFENVFGGLEVDDFHIKNLRSKKSRDTVPLKSWRFFS